MPNYIVESPIGVRLHTTRPKQTDFKAAGPGRYTLRRMDGKVSRIQTVSLNRNGNLKITVETPGPLQGLSEAQLNRLHRLQAQVVKLWPQKLADLRKIEEERDHRTLLLSLAALAKPDETIDLVAALNQARDEALAEPDVAADLARISDTINSKEG